MFLLLFLLENALIKPARLVESEAPLFFEKPKKSEVEMNFKNTSSSTSSLSPCTFPVPSNPEFRRMCHWITPESDLLFCDPEFLLAPSSALEIYQSLANASSNLGRLDYSRLIANSEYFINDVGIAVAVVPSLPATEEMKNILVSKTNYLDIIRKYAPCLPAIDRVTRPESEGQTTASSTEPVLFSYPNFFAEALRLRWFESDCASNALILAIANLGNVDVPWTESENNGLLNYPSVILSLSGRLKMGVNPLIFPSIMKQVEIELRDHVTLSDVLPRLIQAIINVAKESDKRLVRENGVGIMLINHGHVPRWAWLAFASCFLSVILLLLMNWFFLGRIESRRSEASKRSSASGGDGGKAKWKGGGLLRTFMHRKAEGGGGASKPMQI